MLRRPRLTSYCGPCRSPRVLLWSNIINVAVLFVNVVHQVSITHAESTARGKA